MIYKIKLRHDFSTFLNADYEKHKGSCISYQVREQEDIHKTFGGFPESYSEENTKIQQLWFDPIDVDFEDIPPMLIQPYLENALNHGIINKQENGHILVTIKKENQYLVCTITDDGIGRAKAQEIKQSKGYNYKSRGMSITHSRLEIINKMQNSNLNVEVEDLYENDIPAGTKVRIYIPLKPDEL